MCVYYKVNKVDIERFVNEYLEESVFPADEKNPPSPDKNASSVKDGEGPPGECQKPAAGGRS